MPELFTRALFMRLDRAPFTDVRVRQAINHAIDKQAIIEKVLSNKAFPAIGILPNSANAFNKELKGYEYNPEKAKQLLKEAGVETPRRTSAIQGREGSCSSTYPDGSCSWSPS